MKPCALLALGVLVASTSAGAVPVVDRIGEAIDSWTTGAMIEAYGASRPGAMTGQMSNILQKSGRIIKWGGPVVVAGSLMNDMFRWWGSQANDAMHPTVKNWWAGGTAGIAPDPMNYTDIRLSGPSTVQREFCRGRNPNRIPVTYWLAKGPYADYMMAYTANNGGNIQSGPMSGISKDPNAFDASFLQECAALINDQPLSDLMRNDPSVANAIKNALNGYLRSHPDAIMPYINPRPNANQAADDVVDPELDTDEDGYDDGDETGIKKAPNTGNRPSPEDTYGDPNDPNIKPRDTNKNGVPDWRDGDDDGDGTRDEDEPTKAGCQKDPTCNPDTEKDTDHDGIPDRDDPDDDNDGYSDIDEEKAGSDPKSAGSKPQDSDRDGIPDILDPDDDNDGVPDAEDRDSKDPKVGRCGVGLTYSDGNCYPVDKQTPCPPGQMRGPSGACVPDPNPCKDGYVKDGSGNCQPDPKKDDPCPTGQAAGTDGKCKPKQDDPKCPSGQIKGTDGQCGPPEPSCPDGQVKNSVGKCEAEPDENESCPEGSVKSSTGKCESDPSCPEGTKRGSDGKCESPEDNQPVPDDCGDFGIKRLLMHTGHYLRDVVFPCENYDWEKFPQLVMSKFPFSVVERMTTFFAAEGGDSAGAALPSSLGPFALDFGFAAGFLSFIKLAWRAALWWLFFSWLAGRLSGQVVLS